MHSGRGQGSPKITADGSGGAIITWHDPRGTIQDIYAQRIDASSAAQWTVDSVVVSGATCHQRISGIVPDGVGGAFITWEDTRGNYCVDPQAYVQRVSEGVAPVATLLMSFDAAVTYAGVEINWQLAEAGSNMEFYVLRADGDNGPFVELTAPKITCDGLAYNFIDETCEPDSEYRYRVEVSDEAGRRVLFETDPISTPDLMLVLHQNHPNPFNPATTISFTLAEKADFNISVYDAAGRKISCLVDGTFERGSTNVTWDGTDKTGRPVDSGVYFYRLFSDKTVISRKMTLLR